MVVGTDPWWVWVWVWAQTPMGIPTQGPNDDERVKAVQGMSFAEMHNYFKNLKD